MHYLIDGHNLIAHISDIRLSDPDDEEQLVRRLRRWIAAGPRRRITLYFDGGLPGGPAPHFSGGALNVVFASAGRDADSLLTRRIHKVHNPPEFTLVTSDRAIVTAAESRGMPVLSSQRFATLLETDSSARSKSGQAPSPKEDPLLDPDDLAHWLDIFGADDEG